MVGDQEIFWLAISCFALMVVRLIWRRIGSEFSE